jgi:hypothetical protein
VAIGDFHFCLLRRSSVCAGNPFLQSLLLYSIACLCFAF